MKLFICEKPSQARDIAPHVGARQKGNGCFTGPGVTVTWCIGHLLEQAKPEFYQPDLKSWDLGLLPIIPGKWRMQPVERTKAQLVVVRDALATASQVVIATDADREGEVIAREVMEKCRYTGPVSRLWLQSLNEASIKTALGKLLPNEKTLPLYFAGMGRARADWLAGMNVTMALTSAFGTGRGSAGVLHCGRVQTPVLALVVRRERAIANFKPKTLYGMQATFEMLGSIVPMDWVIPKDKLDAAGHCTDKAFVDAAARKVHGRAGRLTAVATTPERELAPLLYSLGGIQREASARYGMKAQAVLDACQALYEKHKATTYPRTDCEYLPSSMFAEARGVLDFVCKADPGLSKIVADVDLTKQGRAFNDKKVTAHHAIIPTLNPSVRVNDMSPVEFQVYDLIRRRYMAQFLGDYEFSQTVIGVLCEEEKFTKTGKTPTFMGWKRAYAGLAEPVRAKPKASASKDDAEEAKEVSIPAVKIGDQAINRNAVCAMSKTKPPKRYTEGTLIAAMDSIDREIDDPRLRKIMQTKEKAGIGTDATRAAIIEGLFKREYIVNEKRFIKPADKGDTLIQLIETVAPELADPVLTAEWEDKLMQIGAGTSKLETFEAELGTWLRQLIDRIRTQAPARAPRAERNYEPSGHACPACGKDMRQRTGPTGAFWGCSGYPACRTSMPDVDGKPGERQPRPPAGPAPGGIGVSGARAAPTAAATPCTTCGKPMFLRNGAKGRFYGCSGYPDCRNTADFKEKASDELGT